MYRPESPRKGFKDRTHRLAVATTTTGPQPGRFGPYPGKYARLVTCFAETAVQSHSNGPAMALGKGQMGNVGLMIFVWLVFSGPGKVSVDRFLARKNRLD